MPEYLGRARLALAVPAVATLAFAFRAGGFFPGVVGVAAAVLALALGVRVTTVRFPFVGWTRGLSVAAGALALLAAWTLVSSSWSDAPARAILEFDRVLVYLGLLVLMGSLGARAGDFDGALRWVALALAVICVAAVLTRLLPEQLPTQAGLLNERLTFPLTYWNALGLVAALALVLCFHLTASEREAVPVRLLGAGLLPAIAVTLYFTFARGPIWVSVLGVLGYVVLARSRALPGALIGVTAPTFLAVREAYGADLLAEREFASDAALAQGRHVLAVLVAATAAAVLLRAIGLRLDRRLAAVELPPGRRRAVLAVLACAGVAALAGIALTVDAPERVRDQYHAFVEGDVVTVTDLRDRLTQAGNNGRLDFWRVAWDEFREAPLRGGGAGTYRLRWERDRPYELQAVDGHSLYLEVAGELGLPGLLFLLAALGALLWGGVRRLRSDDRHAGAAFVAAGLVLLVHAGVDWDWEMPALFGWFFGVGAVGLARGGASPWDPPRVARLTGGLACLVVAVTPALVALGQARLDRSVAAFQRGDCRTAIDAALDSLDALGVRAEPYEILGYCDLRAGQNALAIRAMESARRRDPENWHYAYGLAIAQTLAGRDGRPAADLARRLNPEGELVRELQRGLRAPTPQRRRLAAARADIPFE